MDPVAVLRADPRRPWPWGARKSSAASLENLQTFLKRGDVKDGVEAFQESVLEAAARWSELAESAPQRMARAIETHWGRVPLLSSMGIG